MKDLTSKMTIAEITEALKKTAGKIFSVRFIKRTTGEERLMVARTNVTGYLKGGKKSYDDTEKKLLTVFDMQKEGYRCIPLDAIIEIKANGEQIAC